MAVVFILQVKYVFALKLFLVPAFILLVSLAATRWGPSIAGGLAGLPVVVGPILFFLALEQGSLFASHASAVALSAVFALVAFALAYAHAAQRFAWPLALACALLAWLLASFCLSVLPGAAPQSLAVALLSIVAGSRMFPAAQVERSPRVAAGGELACRIFAGAMLTLAVTAAAPSFGPAWSGLLTAFPIMTMVLAVFSHNTHGPAFVAVLLRALATGLYSFTAFCFTLATALLYTGVAEAFFVSATCAVAVQFVTNRHL